MQPNQILTADLLDILFAGRNKEYGAYQLRRTYDNRLKLSLMVMLLLVSTPVIIYILPGKGKAGSPFSDSSNPLPPILTEVNLIKLPVSSSKQVKQIKTIGSTPPLIVRDKDFKEADKVPEQTDLDNVKIGLANRDGELDAAIQPPDNGLSKGNGEGVATASGANGEGKTEGFRPIERESEYPGGLKAWSRFLNRTLGNNYPADAFEKGIQGTILIQFIVDIDGTVSNIEALSGPEELRNAAINTIKKSGKWIPAIQNGRNVKTFKKQPITFVLQEE